MSKRRLLSCVVVLSMAAGCDGPATVDDGGSVPDGGVRPDAAVDARPSVPDGGDAGTSCFVDRFEPGRWPAPESTFTIPRPASGTMYYPDVQEEFPDVAWDTIDRLYLTAGEYGVVVLGNLPVRTADHPLVITNHGGQVYIGGTGGTARLELYGGANWILTGRYDAIAETGDAAFVGHADGDYAGSHGHYGIEIRQHFVAHSGIKVAGGATDFEVELVEVWETGFAGLLVKTDGEPDATMSNVSLHDLYVHDTSAEGLYIGNTSYDGAVHHTFVGLHVYDNRLLRTGAEAIQISHVGDGTVIEHNVGWCAVDWRDPFQPLYQDGCLQVAARIGDVTVRDNVFLASGGHMFTLRTFAAPTETPSEGDTLTLAHNYFSHGRGARLSYLFSTDTNQLTSVAITGNVARALLFEEDLLDPTAVADPFLVQTRFMPNPITISGTRFDDARALTSELDLVGTAGNLVATDNERGDVPPIAFVASGFPLDFDYRRVERWSDCSTEYDNRPIAYEVGSYVTHDGSLFRLDATPAPSDCSRPYWAPCEGFAIGGAPVTWAVGDVVDTGDEVHYRLTSGHDAYTCATSAELYGNPTPREDPDHWERVVVNPNPRDAPTVWTEVGLPPDDVRTVCGSAHAGIGLSDQGP